MLAPAMRVKGAYDAFGYKAAKVERSAGHATATGGSADLHLRYDRELLGRIADRFTRDNGIYAGILGRWADSVLGPEGFTLDPDTGSKKLNRRIRDDWLRFGEKPEVRGIFDWQECERLSLMAVANHGDVGCVVTNRQKFQFVESEEITGGRRQAAASRNGGRVDQGVEMDRLGAPLAFWLSPRDKNGFVQRRNARRVRADRFVMPANRLRYSQTRGVPILSPVFSMIHRISDVCDSEAISWQTLTKFAMVVTRENSAELAYEESKPDSDGRTSGRTGDADLADRVMELEEAILFFANKGESLTAVQRDLPGKNFPESIRMFLRLIGLPLGLPLEVILLDYSKTNYTSARAALEQAYRMFVHWQRWLKRKHHTPLYLAWLDWQIALGLYPDRLQTRRHGWNAPEFPWVDHLKEAEAWGMRMDRGLATQTMALRSINMDVDDWGDKRELELEDAMSRARRLNERMGDVPGGPVPWQAFAGVPISKQQSLVGPDGMPLKQQEKDA